MKIETIEQEKREGGFTLVELAIVMIIIGLLIGGILKGQELIANSQVTATIAQVKGIDAAVSTFRDKYSALPGDMVSTNRLANCTAAPCSKTAAADGRITGASVTAAGGAPAANRESVIAFAHLAASDLLSGIDAIGGTVTFGSNLPEAKVGGGFTGIEYSTGNLTQTANGAVPGHYLVLNGQSLAVGTTSGDLATARAAQMDRKLDDGSPSSGSVRATTSSNCTTGSGATITYDEDNSVGRCAVYFRVQG